MPISISGWLTICKNTILGTTLCALASAAVE
jgi:hypothetical protein